MTKVVVEAGVCGFSTTITVVKLPSQRVRITLVSDCEMVSKIGGQLEELDWRSALRQKGNRLVYKAAFQCTRHATCPVPVAILKAIEVEVGAALPGDVIIRFEATDDG